MGIAATSTRNNPGARKSLGQFSEMFDENQKTASGKIKHCKGETICNKKNYLIEVKCL